ncbi:MAG: tRNA pseudouridine(38-40) synthase TruA [Bacteroidia bacterium]|nr:tRNA pseudouridine(38-40) synthase TruA [Bacteroidia bacterium]
MRYFLEIAYNGLYYNGWQKQKNASSVQEEIEKCLEIIFKEKILVKGAGRTDAGVHARQQFVQFDTNIPLKSNFLYQLNCLFSPYIVARNIYLPFPQELDVRKNAILRIYKYYIVKQKEPFYKNLVMPFYRKVDVSKMNQACLELLGYKDFASFCKSQGSQLSTFCRVEYAKWHERGNFLIFTIKANRFLRGMVRAIVGTLLQIGTGKKNIEEFKALIAAKDRKLAGENVEPYGLYLHRVIYPPYSLQPVEFT